MKVYHYTQFPKVMPIFESGKLIPRANTGFPSYDLSGFNMPSGFSREGISAMFSPKPELWTNSPLGDALDILAFEKGRKSILLEIETDGLDAFVLDSAYLAVYRAMRGKYLGRKIEEFINPRYLIPPEELRMGEEAILRGQRERFIRSAIPLDQYNQSRDQFLVPEIFIASTSPISVEGHVRVSAEQPLLEDYIETLYGEQKEAFLKDLRLLSQGLLKLNQEGLSRWHEGYERSRESGVPRIVYGERSS